MRIQSTRHRPRLAARRVARPHRFGAALAAVLVVSLVGPVGQAAAKSRTYIQTQARAARAEQARYGKLNPSLYAQLSQTPARKRVQVSIWLDIPALPVSRALGQANQLQSVASVTAPARAAVMTAAARMGGEPSQATYAPAVFARLTPAQIRALARRADVSMIYGQAHYRLFQEDAATTERANSMWAAGDLGFSTASRPAINEPDGVSDGNPALNNTLHPVIYYCSSVSSPSCPNGKNTTVSGGHASTVAGAIASTNPLYRGIAPNAQIILSDNSQTFNDADLVKANEWGRGNGADPTNMSWGTTCPNGQQTFMSRYVDWAEKSLGQTFTISSGNTSGCSGDDLAVSAPGVAWGPITVGAISDNNTGFWNDDSVAAFSRFHDPATGQAKPEIAAVGVNLTETDNTGISAGHSGTSFSAPQIAGQVADMLARQPGQNGWPETNKAAVLASTWHAIGTYDQTGLGAPVMADSDATYQLGRYFNECGSGCVALTPSDFPNGNRDHVVALTAGQIVKVAIAWDSQADASAGTDILGADIDLHVLKPDGTLACASASVANGWEACSFTASTTGNYTFREHLFSYASNWAGTFLGMAYSIQSVPNICSSPASTFGSAGGSSTTSTANGPTYFDTYLNWSYNQEGREQLFTYTNTAPHTLTFSDTNASIDLHAVQFASCSAQPITPTVLANGLNTLTLTNAPAGVYRFIGDGYNGYVGSDTYTLTVAAPSGSKPAAQSDAAAPTGR